LTPQRDDLGDGAFRQSIDQAARSARSVLGAIAGKPFVDSADRDAVRFGYFGSGPAFGAAGRHQGSNVWIGSGILVHVHGGAPERGLA
jgi:hypothetical protein